MNEQDFDLHKYESERDEFLRREANESAQVREIMPNHPANSDHGHAVDELVDRMDAATGTEIPEAARTVLSAVLDATRLHPQAGAIIAARLMHPEARSIRELSQHAGLGRTTTCEVIKALKVDERFRPIFPTTNKTLGQQRRRRRDGSTRPPRSTVMCMACGSLFVGRLGQVRCRKCDPEQIHQKRRRGIYYPVEVRP